MPPFPPKNFIPVKSEMPGFTVYAPDPNVKQAAIEEFKCPQCGAMTAYSIGQAAISCQHCGFVEEIDAQVVGKEAARNDFSLDNLALAAHGWGEERKELKCLSCGAEIAIPAESLVASCAFCGSNKVVLGVASQVQLQPKYLIPFKVDAPASQKIARDWMGKSWMIPKKLKDYASLQPFTPIYIPYWSFHAKTNANWRAEVGHTVSERYYNSATKSWETRTKTVWRWESGNVKLNIDNLLVPGTERISLYHLEKVASFDLNGLTSYAPGFLAGMQAKGYDRALEPAWELARGKMRESTKSACYSDASSSQIRNFSMRMDFEDENWRYLLMPVYLAAYQYDLKTYQAVINGQNGAISGQRPVDWKKVNLVIGLSFLPAIIAAIIALISYLVNGAAGSAGAFVWLLLLVAVISAFVIYGQAKKEGKI